MIYSPLAGAYDELMRYRTLLMSLWGVLLAALPASATILTEDDVASAPASRVWVGSVLTLLLVIAIAIPAFMSSKRGHQD